MRRSLMIFILVFSWHLLADSGQKELAGHDPKVDIISDEYEAGPFLIYDCTKGHWVCVLEEYYKECQAKREEDIHQKKLEVSCAPIAELPTKKSCFQKQLFLVSQNHGNRFCISDSWKEKELKY